MSLSKTTVSLVVGALLLGGQLAPNAEAQPAKPAPRLTKAQQVGVAYNKARKLYRQGQYKAAIQAFDEVKDLRYHPILDYGMSSCYEALGDLAKAIYYLEKYIRNHSKHKMSPKHPKVADVQAKVKALKARAASGGTAPGAPVPSAPPANAPETPGTPAAGGYMGGGDPVPGPDPYAVPPPPGGGATGAVRGGYAPPPHYGAPPSHGGRPPVGVRRFTGRPRRSFMFSVDFGAASLAAPGFDAAVAGTTGGGLTLSGLWRFSPWVAVGLHAGVTVQGGWDAGDEPLLFAVAAAEVRAILPLGRFGDLWASFDLGYGSLTQENVAYGEQGLEGPAVGGGVGLDFFVFRNLSLGLVARVYKVIHTACATYGGAEVCGGLGTYDPGFTWYAGLGVTYHLPLGGRRR